MRTTLRPAVMETTSGNQRSRDYYSIARRGKNTFAQFIDLLDRVSLGTWQGKIVSTTGRIGG